MRPIRGELDDNGDLSTLHVLVVSNHSIGCEQHVELHLVSSGSSNNEKLSRRPLD